MCAYQIERDGVVLAVIGGLAVVPGDGLYTAARKWAELSGLRLVEFQKQHAGGYSVAILEDVNGIRQTVRIRPV